MSPSPLQPVCPCRSGSVYDACCGPLHRGERGAVTAAELMRSRYSAYSVGDLDHVFRTWHPRTRPDDLAGDPSTRWTGLEITEVVAGEPGDDTGIVGFRASFTRDGATGVLEERSRFVRRAGRWVYVEAI